MNTTKKKPRKCHLLLPKIWCDGGGVLNGYICDILDAVGRTCGNYCFQHAISGNNKTPREREFGSRESKTATPTTTKKCVRRKI
jgi:hypothetical protein